MTSIPILLVLLGLLLVDRLAATWLSREAAEWAINDFERHEAVRGNMTWRGHDRRSSAPFISGDGFRDRCHHICEDANRCRMEPENVKDGECIFVKSDFFDFFAKEVTSRIPGRYIIVSHNGDLSVPDGQNDAPAIRMSKYVTSDILLKEYQNGRLIAHHGQNTWWVNKTEPRPPFLHCLPIGVENRQYPTGRQVHLYVEALKRNIINKPVLSIEEQSKKPLLLVAFYPKSRVPDRHKVLQTIGQFPPRTISRESILQLYRFEPYGMVGWNWRTQICLSSFWAWLGYT